MSELADARERERIRHDLEVTFLVEAAAGTGKTTELVHRMIAVLASGRGDVQSLVAVTFTEKAAGELKLRLRAELERARQQAAVGSSEREHFEAALARLEEARVSTIHGFCADLLRERPVEARVDPRFRVMTEGESRRMFAREFSRWLQGVLENPPEGTRRALRRFAAAAGGPSGRLQQAAWTLAEWRDFRATWRRDVFARDAAIDALVEQVHAFAALTTRCSSPHGDFLYRDTEGLRRLGLEIRASEAVRPRDYDGLEASLSGLLLPRSGFRRPGPGRGQWYGKGLAREEVLSAHELLLHAVEDFSRRADADLAPLLQSELFEVVRRYEQVKQRSGCVDFLDLLLRARDLVRDCDSVRADFQRRFSHIFVDEFQDTDPLQAEILMLLAAADSSVNDWREAAPLAGKLFLVGDPKQSIYRFRRADVGVYLEVKQRLLAGDAECLRLVTSFRSRPAIQRLVNAAFEPLMRGDRTTLQADYVPLAPWREDEASQPAVVVLPVPRPLGKRSITQGAIEASLPDATGALVEWLVKESGWTVSERDTSTRVKLEARHICLLFRRFDSRWKAGGDVTREYVQALEARGIPHLLVGGSSFHGREEVEAMRAALSAIEWPDDELSVFATLHGSFFAIGDEVLFEYRHLYRRLYAFNVPADLPEHLKLVGMALRILGDLHRGRNHRTVAETIALLLEATRAHAGLVLRPSGEQVLANVLHLAELARLYESSGGTSFRGFVQEMLDEADGGKTAEAPILEEGSDGVRLMTVHKAKGLEFPVVILADLTCHLTRNYASRAVDTARNLCAVRLAGWSPAELLEHEEEEIRRDSAEGVRVAYVAATRARDLLVVPAVGPEIFESGWLGPLNDAVYPLREGGRWAEPTSTEVAGCPPLGASTLVAYPPGLAAPAVARSDDDASIRPGRFDFDGSRSVVWFDPNLLRLDAQPLFGIRQEELIGKDAPAEVVAADLKRYDDWRADRAAALQRGARPSAVVQTATARALAGEGAAADVEVIELARPAGRPAGARFGALVHAVLADIDLDAPRAVIADSAQMYARIGGAEAAEVAAAVDAVEAALRHPLLARARAAQARGDCRRETPIGLREDDGAIIDGVVDLAFLEAGRWLVVDFKTDRELSLGIEPYQRQVAIYARAIAAATGQPASGVLLRV